MILHVACGELAPHRVDDAPRTSASSRQLAVDRAPVDAQMLRDSSIVHVRCRAASRPARAPARSCRLRRPRLVEQLPRKRAIAGSAFGLGMSRSLRAQTMPLKSWPNSTMRPNTRSCTERSAGASCAKHTRRGCQSGAEKRAQHPEGDADRELGGLPDRARSADDQLLAQHDDVAAILDRSGTAPR